MHSDNPYLNQLYKNTHLAFYYIERALRKDINSEIVINNYLYIDGVVFNYQFDNNYLKDLCLQNGISYSEERKANKKVL